MGFELISRAYMTPHRLYSMIHLVEVLGESPRRMILDLLQPESLTEKSESQEMSERLYRAAIQLGLLEELPNKDKTVRRSPMTKGIEDFETFRLLMQSLALCVVDEPEDHYLLNLVAAWYAVQDEAVLDYSKGKMEKRFNEQLYGSAESIVLSDHPGLTAWFEWAQFLGWGWLMKFSREEGRLAPDATLRVRPLLPKLLPHTEPISMGEFMSRLRELCPELDGGLLFKRCWEASRGSEVQGNRLSLMLSTALRVLHISSEIELIERKDASESWRLFASQSHVNQVTHIRRRAIL
jgi:hypothetical protein